MEGRNPSSVIFWSKEVNLVFSTIIYLFSLSLSHIFYFLFLYLSICLSVTSISLSSLSLSFSIILHTHIDRVSLYKYIYVFLSVLLPSPSLIRPTLFFSFSSSISFCVWMSRRACRRRLRLAYSFLVAVK